MAGHSIDSSSDHAVRRIFAEKSGTKLAESVSKIGQQNRSAKLGSRIGHWPPSRVVELITSVVSALAGLALVEVPTVANHMRTHQHDTTPVDPVGETRSCVCTQSIARGVCEQENQDHSHAGL